VEVGYRGVDGPIWKKAKKYIKALKGLDHHLFSDKSLDNMATESANNIGFKAQLSQKKRQQEK